MKNSTKKEMGTNIRIEEDSIGQSKDIEHDYLGLKCGL